MLVVLLLALVVFVAIFIVGYPLVNARLYPALDRPVADDRLENLMSARNSVFDAIRDLEFDHAAGKLSDEDYRQMRARYDVRAAEVLQKMDALTASATKKENGKDAAPASCPTCHAKLKAGDRFCPTCGNKLT